MIPKIPSSNLVKSDGVLKGSVVLNPELLRPLDPGAPGSGIGLLNPAAWPELVIVQTETIEHGDVNNVYRKAGEVYEANYLADSEFAGCIYVADGLPSLHLLNS